ncbi:ABC-three component system protein [Halalkalibacter alkalisediminis]|uniref:ABC-three component system protein n=1 Tax=Halalkalibacter alkalisediminis TaxID=935616 RepID=A0ABV6NME5_9BACI|nr:ABC-three component system protein [Halalkalibacter alkalisediminis]
MSRSSTSGDHSPVYNNDGHVYQQNIIHMRSDAINPYNLKKVIDFLELELEDELEPNRRVEDDDGLKRIDIIAKNVMNNLEEEGCSDYNNNIIESSIYFKTIKDILSAPRNKGLRKSYNNIKKTINNKIPDIKREKNYFSEVLNDIIDRFLNSNDIEILENEEMVSVVIHFMYYICHIGENGGNNAETG